MKREVKTLNELKAIIKEEFRCLDLPLEMSCFSDNVMTYTQVNQGKVLIEVNVIADDTYIKTLTVLELLSLKRIGYLSFKTYSEEQVIDSLQYTPNEDQSTTFTADSEGEELITALIDSDGDELHLVKTKDGAYMLRFRDVFFQGGFYLTEEAVDELQIDFDMIHQFLPSEEDEEL